MKSYFQDYQYYFANISNAYLSGEDETLLSLLDEWESVAIQKGGGMYPDATHARHVYQGMLALRRDDVETAKAELIKAGQVTSSLALRFMGPNMILADALLRRGEREAVFHFFKALRNFWILPIRIYCVHKWTTAIAAGETDVFRSFKQEQIIDSSSLSMV